ncbi:succinylglutamate desuccinylase [Francisella sciaenopsi]|uniref:Succinylglutamate desuccinylase n=1 Tax=Francisella sciaenopsi TaxID=3055034 RepID=A0ABQ6PDD6_9GAMM
MNMADEIIDLFSQKHYPKVIKVKNDNFIKYYNDGIVAIFPTTKTLQKAMIVSAGIHGDETGPVELVYKLFNDLINGNITISRPLMIIVGNLEAIRQGKRQIEVNLNRCFDTDELNSNNSLEHEKALDIITAIDHFKKELDAENISIEMLLDLHSYVYPEYFYQYQDDKTQFAICVKEQPYNLSHEKILSACNLGKVITDINMKGTLVSFIVKKYPHITSMVFELGHAHGLGDNNPLDLENISNYIYTQVSEKYNQKIRINFQQIEKYKFCPPVIKNNETFELNNNICLRNFTKYKKGTVLAYEDGEVIYQVPSDNHTVLFPWPTRPVGAAGTYILERL